MNARTTEEHDHRRQRHRRPGRRAVVPADEETDDSCQRTEADRDQHDRRDPATDEARGSRWSDEEGEHQQVADRLERRHDRDRDEGEQRGVGEPRAQPEHAGERLVERHHEKGAVEDDHPADRDRGRDRLTGDVVVRHARDRPEQEPVQVAGVRRSLGRHDHHRQGEEPDEQHADRGVVGERAVRPDEADPADHRTRRDQRAERGALADDECDRDAGQHSVGEGVTEEAHPAQHDPRSDHRCRDDGEQTRHERVAHEPVVDERLDPPRPRVTQPRHDRASTISRASVDSRPRYVSAPDSPGPSESVNSVTTSTSPTAVGEGLGLDARVLGLGEDGGHVGLLDEIARVLRGRRRSPRRASTATG